MTNWKIRRYPLFNKKTHNTLTLLSHAEICLFPSPSQFSLATHHHHDANIAQPQRLLTSSLSPVLDLAQESIKFNTTRQHRWTRNLVSSLLHQVSHSIPSPILILVVVNGLDTILIFPSLLCLFNPQFWFPQYQFCKGWIMKYCFDFPNLICLLFNPPSLITST